jgi:hypothetical protein
MLDAETKRRIDACRDILVGKVPGTKLVWDAVAYLLCN